MRPQARSRSMRSWIFIALLEVLLSAGVSVGATQDLPIPANPRAAHIALVTSAGKRCPDLRLVTDDTAALVLLLVDHAGRPSRITIKSSSGSDALDRAAIDCVSKLRFDPAT